MSKSKSKPSWKLVVFIFIVLMIILTLANSGNKKAANNPVVAANQSQPVANKQLPAIGQAVRDGKFEFTLTKIDCGATSVGTGYLTKTAQGQYCLLSMSVKNIGDHSQSLIASNQYLYNATGQQYSADDVATMYESPDNNAWYDNINPGNSVTGTVVFDIPKDQAPVTASLHDSLYSGGVKVSLK